MLRKEDVHQLAELARISLTSQEEEEMAPKLDSILGYVAEISEVVTADQPAKPGIVKNVLREDVPTNPAGGYSEKILDNAPERNGDFVKVKQIF